MEVNVFFFFDLTYGKGEKGRGCFFFFFFLKTLFFIGLGVKCYNPSFGLATKAKGLQRCGPRGSLGVTSHTPRSVGKCEGVNLHTPKATPTLGDVVPMDSRNFRERFEGVKTQWLVAFFISLEISWNVDV